MKKNKQNRFNSIKLIPFFIVIVVIFLSTGFAEYSDNFAISNGSARILKDAIVRVTHTSMGNNTNGGTIDYLEFGPEKVTTDFSLPNANSTVTINVSVTNLGNTEMGISDITGLPSNLKYTINGYNLGVSLCDSIDNTKCTLGATTNFQITIEYDTNGYDGITTDFSSIIEFTFHEMIYTARIGTHYYETIQEAINDSPTDGTETTIVLLKNVYQRIQVWRGNNIVLDMEGLVLHNKPLINDSGDPVVEIFGARDKNTSGSDTSNVGVAIFKMINGTIMSDSTQAAINVEKGGKLIMTGGSIIATGKRQSVYLRNGGIAEISGTAYLKARAIVETNNARGTVQNESGTLVITGGTFESDGTDGIALSSNSKTTIGTSGGGVSTTTPEFIGPGAGIRIKNNTTFNFYDGIAKGESTAIINENDIDGKESGYSIVNSGETINNKVYRTAFLSSSSVTITFDSNNGTQTELTRIVAPGVAIGPLPTTERNGFEFLGWYDENDNLMSLTSTVNANTVISAKWAPKSLNVVRIGSTEYITFEEALLDVPANTETTITVIDNISLSNKITIPSNKNIVIDLNNYKIENTSGTTFENSGTIKIIDSGSNGLITGGLRSGNKYTPVIYNQASGTINLVSGEITSTVSQVVENYGTINMTGGKISIGNVIQGIFNNNNGAIFNMSAGEIVAATAGSKRQAIYNVKGTVNISGTAYLFSASTDRATVQNNDTGGTINISGGTIISSNSSCQRGAIQNSSGSTVNLTGGTVISKSNYSGTASGNGPSGIQNEGTLIVGVQGGGIDTTNPIIRGQNKGIYSYGSGSTVFYDGIIQSLVTPMTGNYTLEANTQPNTSGTVQIDGNTYHTWYLESNN